VPLSWDEKGVVVLVDDPSDSEKKAIIKTELETEWVIFAIGIKEDIEAFINRSFSQLEIDDFFSRAMSGKEPINVTKLVDILITEAYTKGASDIYFESSAVSGENRVLFWMDGAYREYMTLAEVVAYDAVKRIKTLANLDGGDRQLAKVGHLIFENNDVPEIQISVTTYPIDGLWEDVVLGIPAV
jgi:type II secretory ATPase GspE/PulE/Tfp pilus assembly ATPase PilB-like protein